MKYLFTLLLMLVSFNAFSCGKDKNVLEKEAFVSVRSHGDSSIVDIYFPRTVEGAAFSGAIIRYEQNDKSIFSMPLAAHDTSKYKTSEQYKDMMATNISGHNSELTNFTILVMYRFPVGKDGFMAMCGPEREYRVSELTSGKL